MPTLYLVRHAEPVLTGVLLGRTDPELSPKGHGDAQSIQLPPVRVIYTSQLKRAQATADLIAARTCIVVMPDLNEISYGDWDGLTWAEIEARDPEVAARKLHTWTGVTPPGGEAWAGFDARIAAAANRIRNGPFPAAVVGHTAANALLAAKLTGVDPFQFRQNYCEVRDLVI
ncbi:MAG TPA: histidine phosphatase family protein [Bryobacteraceae bacterium]|nr:histidine phosphatase family protein [Bryobacteraceae bacterium]